jgi:hypothetical protein
MKKKNNVVEFPFPNKNLKNIKSLEEINSRIELMKHYHIQETIGNILPYVFNQLEVAGFLVSDDDGGHDIKSSALIVESIRAFMCKQYGIFHPFQKISEEVFSIDSEEETTLRIVDKLHLNLKNEKKG